MWVESGGGKETWGWDHKDEHIGTGKWKGGKEAGMRRERGVGARVTCSGQVKGRVQRRWEGGR
jgi:hypothetical protein